MGTVSEKLTYLNDTKELLKTVINYADAGIDDTTTFRNYAVKLYDAYVEILKDKYVLLDEMPKGTSTGTNINITNAENLPVYELKIDKESTQATSILPSEYTQVNYLQSSGTQYIDTLYTPISNDEFEFKNVTLTSNECIFSAGTGDYQLLYSKVGDANYFKYFATGSASSFTLSSLNNNNISIDKNGNLYIDGVLKTTSAYGGTANTTLNLFRRANNTSYISGNIGEVKITNNNVVKLDLIPCFRNSDSVVGMYDLVSNTFLTNSGTGVFSYGSVETLPNPNNSIEVETVKGYQNELSAPASDGTVSDLGIILTYNTNNEYKLKGTATNSGNMFAGNLSNYYTIKNGDYLHIGNDSIPTGTIQIVALSSSNNQIFAFSINALNRIVDLSSYAGKEIKSFFFLCVSGVNVDMTLKPMILNNISITNPYVPYGSNYVNVSVTGKNKITFDNITEGTTLSIEKTFNINFMTLDGTTSGSGQIIPQGTSLGITLPAGTYTVAFKVKSGTYDLNGDGHDIGFYFRDVNNTSLASIVLHNLSLDGSVASTQFSLSVSKEIYFYAYANSSGIELNDLVIEAQIESGSTFTGFEEYQHNNYPIPLNNNEIVGIGDYKDELLIDKGGNVYINKKTGKVVLNGSETITSYAVTSLSGSYQATFNIKTKESSTEKYVMSNYFQSALIDDRITKTNIIYTYTDGYLRIANNVATTEANFKTWLSTHNTSVYYVLATENLIDLNTTVDVRLFKGTNIITNLENANMNIRYIKNINDIINSEM